MWITHAGACCGFVGEMQGDAAPCGTTHRDAADAASADAHTM